MTRPNSRSQAAMSAAFARAVDLSSLKNRPAPGGTAAPSASSSEHVIDVNEATFAEVVARSSQILVVIDLWATWCEPCKQLSPVLERLAEQGNGAWVLAKVDVDANPRIAQAFGVQSIPTVVALAGGQPVDAFAGAQPEPQVRQWISGLLDALRGQLPGIAAAEAAAGEQPTDEVEDERFTAAEDAVAAGDYMAAEAAYRGILDQEPGNADAKAALGQVAFLARAAAIDPAVVARADAAPDDVTLACQAADVQVADGAVADAFARLVGVVRRSAGDERKAAREHLVELFALFPPDDEQVVAARRALAAALF